MFFKKKLQKQRYNEAHLSVLFDQPSSLHKLKNLSSLLTKKNIFNLTPPQLAMYLNRKQCLEKLNHLKPKKIQVEKEGIIHELSIAKFEKLMGIEYLPNFIFYSFKELKQLISFHKKAHRKNWISHEEKWRGIYFQKELIEDIHPNIVIKWMGPHKGYGLFANEDLKKGKWIGQYTGVLRKFHFRKDQKNAYCFEYFSKSSFTIDAKDKGNLTRFINHSYQPNLTPRLIFLEPFLHIVFLTSQAIKKGDELTYDYGIDYWKKRETPL